MTNTIIGYTYKADNFCPGCIIDQIFNATGSAAFTKFPETALNIMAEDSGIDRSNEYTFDSDEFPKVITEEMVSGAYSVGTTCGNCNKNLGGIA